MAHCSTCTCEPKTGWHVSVYPPNKILYGTCETCGQIRWGVDRFDLRYRESYQSLHCGCCTHLHDLPPGGHHLSEAAVKRRRLTTANLRKD